MQSRFRPKSFVQWGIGLWIALTTAGCGKPYRQAEVDGILLIGGKPADDIQVQFIPDAGKQTSGPTSIATTNAAGKFSLQLREPDGNSSSPGAVVGWHRVVLADERLAKSETGQGVRIRLDPKYTLPGSTPLTEEVKEGRQTIEIQLPQ